MFRPTGIAAALTLLLAFGTLGRSPSARAKFSDRVGAFGFVTLHLAADHRRDGEVPRARRRHSDDDDLRARATTFPKLHFAAALAGEVRYDRFSLLTDILYLSVGTSTANIRSFDFGLYQRPGGQDPDHQHEHQSPEHRYWTLAGGYTVAEGDWGNVDLVGGGDDCLRIDSATNFSLALDITRPDGSIALGRTGGLSASRSVWNGIGGVRGRLYLGDADWFGGGKFFVPYYFDVSAAAALIPTWQVIRRSSATRPAGSAYRSAIGILSFQQGSGVGGSEVDAWRADHRRELQVLGYEDPVTATSHRPWPTMSMKPTRHGRPCAGHP